MLYRIYFSVPPVTLTENCTGINIVNITCNIEKQFQLLLLISKEMIICSRLVLHYAW